VASKREIIGGLTSVLLHAGLLAWVVLRPPAPTVPAVEPAVELVEITRLELTPITHGPLAAKAEARPEGDPLVRPPGEPTATEHPPEPPTEPRRPRKPPHTTLQRPDVPLAPAGNAEAEATPTRDDASAGPPLVEVADDGGILARARARQPSEGRGSAGAGEGRSQADGALDHTAYGSQLVRIVKAEIDEDPVPGLGPQDSIEVVLEVLPNGRLARWGLGKYDYAQVVRSTLGPLRMRAILRRILRASQGFPPHPSSFPRQRFVVGIRVNFRELHG
jgi:hypothetical protein